MSEQHDEMMANIQSIADGLVSRAEDRLKACAKLSSSYHPTTDEELLAKLRTALDMLDAAENLRYRARPAHVFKMPSEEEARSSVYPRLVGPVETQRLSVWRWPWSK